VVDLIFCLIHLLVKKVPFLDTCYQSFHTMFTGMSKKIKKNEKNEWISVVHKLGNVILDFCINKDYWSK
jgi:hypothetical protein